MLDDDTSDNDSQLIGLTVGDRASDTLVLCTGVDVRDLASVTRIVIV